MVAEHAEVRGKTARKTPVPAKNVMHHRERGNPRGSDAQEFSSVEHLQRFSGSQDRPARDPLQGPAASRASNAHFPVNRTRRRRFFSWEDPAMNQSTATGSRGLARLCQHDLLSIDEERRLFGRLKVLKAKGLQYRRSADKVVSKEAVAIRNRIVESNLRLVVSLATHFAAPERSLEELVSEASLPLIRCVESFDSGRGTRFSTYATRAAHEFFRAAATSGLPPAIKAPFRRRSGLRHLDGRPHRSNPNNLIQAEECRRLAEQLARLSFRERARDGSLWIDGGSPPAYVPRAWAPDTA